MFIFLHINYVTMSQTILSLKNVSIYQENNLILSDINLEVQKGEFLYFIGKYF